MNNGSMKKTLLVIDDDRIFGKAVKDYLSSDEVEVLLATKAADGLTLCSLGKIDVVVLDQRLPDAEGHTLCPDILKYNDQAKIIFSTAYPSFDNAVKAIRTGAYNYLSKPYDLEELALAVKQAFRTVELEKVEQVHELERERESAELVFIGGEGLAGAKQLMDIAQVADAPVLVTGETGTGKSLAARTIHYNSSVRKGPFISINCASLPESLIEAELFGYERGAFTGAVNAKKGLFEVAEGGSIFLDEIGEMPSHLQSKLLSAIDEKRIRRLGGTLTKRVRVRIIAATSVDLDQMLGKTFRSDLYYRLSVVRIHIPPLRERSTDIPALCTHLLRTLTTRTVTLGDDEWERLKKYDWPGNVRELRNVLERTLLIQKGEVLEPSQLLEKRVAKGRRCSAAGAQESEIKPLADSEQELIRSALAKLSGNLMQTAKALGISVTTLKRRLREHD